VKIAVALCITVAVCWLATLGYKLLKGYLDKL
jgi:hypothetical protein